MAEATITGFDDSGKPNVGTTLIDRDANGVGWFIDETPLVGWAFQNTENVKINVSMPTVICIDVDDDLIRWATRYS